jgi:hypothetical protein
VISHSTVARMAGVFFRYLQDSSSMCRIPAMPRPAGAGEPALQVVFRPRRRPSPSLPGGYTTTLSHLYYCHVLSSNRTAAPVLRFLMYAGQGVVPAPDPPEGPPPSSTQGRVKQHRIGRLLWQQCTTAVAAVAAAAAAICDG